MVRGATHFVRPSDVGGTNAGYGHSIYLIELLSLELIKYLVDVNTRTTAFAGMEDQVSVMYGDITQFEDVVKAVGGESFSEITRPLCRELTGGLLLYCLANSSTSPKLQDIPSPG